MTDIVTMEVLSKALAWAFPGFQFQWIVPQFEENLSQQLGGWVGGWVGA